MYFFLLMKHSVQGNVQISWKFWWFLGNRGNRGDAESRKVFSGCDFGSCPELFKIPYFLIFLLSHFPYFL